MLRIHSQIRDSLTQTFNDLWSHKLRSVLTMFGIAWGMLSLLLLGSVGEGFRQGQKQQMKEWGEDQINFWGGRIHGADGTGLTERYLQLTEDDCLYVIAHSPLLRSCAPELWKNNMRVEGDKNDLSLSVVGVQPNIQGPRFLPVNDGRFVDEGDVAARRRIAVLGHRTAHQLFPADDGLGKEIRVNQIPFQVVGILKQIGREGRGGMNDVLFIPLSTTHIYFPHPRETVYPGAVGGLILQPVDAHRHKQAIEQLHAAMAQRHGIDAKDRDAFDEWDTIAGFEQVETIMKAMDIFLGSVGVVTILLGAIGVMNIMLVAVSERTHEIGVRKAMGATARDILALFLLEGLAMIFISGGAGLATGWGITKVLQQIPMPEGFLAPTVTWSLGVEALIVLAFTALAATLIPAQRAAVLPPASAMRYEP